METIHPAELTPDSPDLGEAKGENATDALSEAWAIIYAQDGQESWDRAQKWLIENWQHKPPGIDAEWMRKLVRTA